MPISALFRAAAAELIRSFPDALSFYWSFSCSSAIALAWFLI
jgi:hypothetical protein